MLKINYQKEFYKKYIEKQMVYTPVTQNQQNTNAEQTSYIKPFGIGLSKRIF